MYKPYVAAVGVIAGLGFMLAKSAAKKKQMVHKPYVWKR